MLSLRVMGTPRRGAFLPDFLAASAASACLRARSGKTELKAWSWGLSLSMAARQCFVASTLESWPAAIWEATCVAERSLRVMGTSVKFVQFVQFARFSEVIARARWRG